MPEDITLPDGRKVTAQDWEQLSPELQKAAMTPGLLAAPGSKARNANTDFSSLASPEAGGALFRALTQNVPMAGVGAFTGGLTGGPVGAVMGAGMMGAFPPQNLTQALEAGAGQFGAGMASKLEGIARPFLNPFAKTALRGALGLTQNKIDDLAIRKPLGEEQQSGMMGNTVATLLPMLFGNMADKTNSPRAQIQTSKRNIQANINEMMGKKYDINAANAKLAAIQGNASAQDAFDTTQQALKAVPEAQNLQQEKAQTQAQLSQIAQSNLQRNNATRDQLLTAPQYNDAASQAERAAYLAQNDKERNKYLKLANFKSASDPDIDAIKTLQKQRSQIANQEWHPYLTDSDRKLQLAGIDDQINQHLAASFSQKLDAVRKASAANAQDLFNAKNPGTAQLQQTIDATKAAVDKNPIENIFLKNLIAPPPNAPGTPQGTPNKPASVDSFVNNLMNLDERHVDKLYEFLGTQPNGDKMIQGVRDAMMNKFFALAYDPKTNQLSRAQNLLAGDGPFNDAKLQSLFGGGTDGRARVNAFGQLVQDLNTLERNQALAGPSPMKTRLSHWGLYTTPTGIATLVGHHLAGPTGAMTGMAAVGIPTLAFTGYSKLVDWALENPAFAKAFHDWASKGGDMDALKYTPLLSSRLVDKADKK